MTIESVHENGANKENYEQAQSTIDRVLSKVASLKESEANEELKRQVNELDEAYERAIKLRMMRIDTLVAHCSDRDTELVELRLRAHSLERGRSRALYGLLSSLLICSLCMLHLVAPDLFTFAFEHSLSIFDFLFSVVSKSALYAAITSCVFTFAAQRMLLTFN